MKITGIVEALVEAGATPAMILAAVRSAEEQKDGVVEAGKEKARARWKRWDEKRRSNVGKRLPTSANNSRVVEDKPLPTDIEPQESKKDAPKGDVEAFRSGLSPDLPPDLLTEFIKVRRKKRGALTGFAANLFREDAAKVGMSVAEAAKECVRSSWITVKPEYFQNRQRAGPVPLKPNPALAAVDALMDKIDAISPSETTGNPPHTRLVALTGGR